MVSTKSEPSITVEMLDIRRELLRRIGDPRVTQRMLAGPSSDTPVPNLNIHYHMPKAAVFQQFAREAGEQLTIMSGDAGYSDQVVVDGLANFLKIVCELTLNRLNKLSEA